MNRRTFATSLLSGMALAASPHGIVAATTPVGGALLPSRGTRPFAAMLDRARAALDRHGAAFQLTDRVALADFGIHSKELRFHIVDLIGGQVSSYLVAHGMGSDPAHSGWLHTFSNVPDSLATSAGAYKTGPIYDGVHGAAMRLIGLDPLNSNAEARAIVLHGADYVSENHIARWGKLGRSNGCFVFARHRLPEVLGLLGPGRLLLADKLSVSSG